MWVAVGKLPSIPFRALGVLAVRGFSPHALVEDLPFDGCSVCQTQDGGDTRENKSDEGCCSASGILQEHVTLRRG